MNKTMIEKPYITVYTITYNEEHMIEFFIKHYRKMFPNCIINVLDNYSTDDTVEIAKSYGCNIDYFQSEEGKLISDNKIFTEIKNEKWKRATTDWVIACDADELIQITQDELMEEEKNGVNIIAPVGWHMINNKDNIINLPSMEHAWEDDNYSKKILFNKKYIKEINYVHGAHLCKPVGFNVKYSEPKKCILTHYKFVSKEFSLKKRINQNTRWSQFNKQRWGQDYVRYMTDEYWDGWYNKPLTNIKHLMK